MFRAIVTWVVVVGVSAAPAQAAFPGQNGRIAYTVTSPQTGATDVFSAEPTGDAIVQLTHDGISDNPVFSPDGSQLAFTSGTKIYVGDQYANDRQLVLDPGVGSNELDWSPAGDRLVASLPNCAEFDCEPDIYTFALDGSGLTNLTSTAYGELNPAWSPDGTKIAFDANVLSQSDVYTINSTGGGLSNLTQDLAGHAEEPDWSPDSQRIVFQQNPGGQVYLVTSDPDGANRSTVSAEYSAGKPAWSPDGARFAYSTLAGVGVGVTNPPASFAAFGHDPDWQVAQNPQPPAGGAGYPRPKTAATVTVALVPAFLGCGGDATMQHGPPLAYPSCPPRRLGFFDSTPITFGTPDNNGLPANAGGFVHLDVIPGNGATPADEADVRIRVAQSDVRRFSRPDHPDYTGNLALGAKVRVTDRWNAGGGSDGSGTTVDFTLRAAVPCAATAGSEGAECSVHTTMEAITPGSVHESKRSVWQLGQVSVYTEHPDGSAGALLLVQGLFVP